MINIIPEEETKKIIKDITTLLLNMRYFYCASENCKKINSGFEIFCDDHNIHNVKKLKSSVDEIPRNEVKRLIKEYIRNNYELLFIDLEILEQLK